MEFKKIQLNGFKSFSEKTTFLIEKGLTDSKKVTELINNDYSNLYMLGYDFDYAKIDTKNLNLSNVNFQDSTLIFEYIVDIGHNSEALDYVSSSSFSVLEGVIEDLAKNEVNLLLPDPVTGSSISTESTYIIDTRSPEVISVNSLTGLSYKPKPKTFA